MHNHRGICYSNVINALLSSSRSNEFASAFNDAAFAAVSFIANMKPCCSLYAVLLLSELEKIEIPHGLQVKDDHIFVTSQKGCFLENVALKSQLLLCSHESIWIDSAY